MNKTKEETYSYYYDIRGDNNDKFYLNFISDEPQEKNIFDFNNDENIGLLQNNTEFQIKDITTYTYDQNEMNLYQRKDSKEEKEKEKNKIITLNHINIAKKEKKTIKKQNAIETKKLIKKIYDETKEKIFLDNDIRRAKILLIRVLRKHINKKIENFYKNKLIRGVYSILKNIDNSQINVGKKDYNLELMEKPLKEILSSKINKKYNSESDINQKMIEKLLSEKDDKKRQFFEKIFNKSFREWINDFKDLKDEELKNLYEKELESTGKAQIIDNIIKNYENIFEIKVGRKGKENQKKKNIQK